METEGRLLPIRLAAHMERDTKVEADPRHLAGVLVFPTLVFSDWHKTGCPVLGCSPPC